MKNHFKLLFFGSLLFTLVNCGGGGGNNSAPVIFYPYETVFGDTCATFEATPGCTFSSTTGQRITVTEDPHYNDFGHGSDDMWFVTFDFNGTASVYNNLGQFQYFANVSEFAGWVGGNFIGVGTTGLFWENITGGTYWLGKNGVLYSANTFDSNFGQAINDKSSSQATDNNFEALASDTNKKLIKMASQKLVKDYGFKEEKATAVASALNMWAIASAERGYTSSKDMDKTFKAVFGVKFSDSLAALKDLQAGEPESMRELTSRSANALGLKPHEAQKFMKGMYKKALADWGYSEDSFTW